MQICLYARLAFKEYIFAFEANVTVNLKQHKYVTYSIERLSTHAHIDNSYLRFPLVHCWIDLTLGSCGWIVGSNKINDPFKLEAVEVDKCMTSRNKKRPAEQKVNFAFSAFFNPILDGRRDGGRAELVLMVANVGKGLFL